MVYRLTDRCKTKGPLSSKGERGEGVVAIGKLHLHSFNTMYIKRKKTIKQETPIFTKMDIQLDQKINKNYRMLNSINQ